MDKITEESINLDCDQCINENEFQSYEKQFILVRKQSDIDILDESLYCYENVIFGLTPAIQNRTSERLLRKVKQFIDSVPTVQKSIDYVQTKTEFIPRFDLIPDEIKEALKNGTAEMIPSRDNKDMFFLQIRSKVKGLKINGKEYGINKKIKDIPLGKKNCSY